MRYASAYDCGFVSSARVMTNLSGRRTRRSGGGSYEAVLLPQSEVPLCVLCSLRLRFACRAFYSGLSAKMVECATKGAILLVAKVRTPQSDRRLPGPAS